MKRVLLIGEGPTAASALESLQQRFEVVGLARSADDAVTGRARGEGVAIVSDSSLPAIETAVQDLAPDCVVVSSYDRLIPVALVDRCPFVNVHYAPLPEYRGRATVNWAILNRRTETAITVHVLTGELDAGRILFQRSVAICAHDTVTDLYARLNELQRIHLGAVVERYLAGDEGTAQDQTAATYTCTRVLADGEIDWTRPTEDVYALVRALTEPYPGAFTYIDGQPLIVWQAAPADAPGHWTGRVPGRVVGRSSAEGWTDVLTGDGVLRLKTVQLDGYERQPAAEVIVSLRSTLGLRASDVLNRLRAVEEALRRVSLMQQEHDHTGDDGQDPDPAPQRHPFVEEDLTDERDEDVTETVQGDDLREVLAAIQVQAHEQHDGKQRATGPEAALGSEAPELTEGTRVGEGETADLNESRAHEVRAGEAAGDRRQHQHERSHHDTKLTPASQRDGG